MEAELAMRKLQGEVDRVIVVGFSMGGLIAMYLSLRYPIDKLILFKCSSKIYKSAYPSRRCEKSRWRESITKKYPPNTFYHLYNYKLTHTPPQ